ncbi:hypothetical protein M5689_008870 [Euphorbia peplus]|nr:hypothetical protein M5689_008870 [Euphorbia peplus]
MLNEESSTDGILTHLISEVTEHEPKTHQNTKSQIAKKAIKSTNDLANHLPTGTLLLYQLLSPILSNQGKCDRIGRILTAILIAICGTLCFVLSFADSFKDKKGNVCCGIATWQGLWVIHGSQQLSDEDSAKYKVKILDFVHAFMTLLVFVTVALSDTNVTNCFFPTEDQWIRTVLPIGISCVCSALFVAFPTSRHGIGFPISNM